MARNIAYWEQKVADALQAGKWLMAQIRDRGKRRARPAFLCRRKRDRALWFSWIVRRRQWFAQERVVRRLKYRLQKIESRIPYYEERIAALRGRTSWDRLRKGGEL